MALEKIKPRVVDETGNYTFNNVTATGSIISANANLGNIARANFISTDNLLYANGVAWSIGTGSVVGSDTQVQFNDGGTGFGASSNFTFNKATNVLTVTNITANGAALTSLTGANVTGTVANATYSTSAGTATTATTAGTVTTNAQPNITSVGSLSTLTVTGNLVSGNAELGNSTTSNYYLGNGYFLSSVSGGNVLGQVAYAGTANSVAGSNVVGAVTYASTANAVAGGNVMGQVGNALLASTVYTNAQPNITSVGTLTSLDVTGNVSANFFIGNGSQLTGITISGAYSNTNTAAYLTANPPTGTYSNTNVTAYLSTHTSNVSANFFIGNGSTLTYITGANITGNAPFAGTANYANTANAVAGANVSGQVSNALVAGTVYTAAQPNITSVGTLTDLTVSNSIVAGGGYGTVTTTQYSSIFAKANGLNATSLIQVKGNDGTNGMGMRAITGGAALIYSNAAIELKVGATIRDLDVPTGGTTIATIDSTGLAVTGNITSGNATLGNAVTANYFVGSGIYVTGVAAATAAIVTTNAQPHITSVGTLTSLIIGNATANTTFGNGTITATGNISFTGANVSLGDASSVKITGGTAGYFLSTDGAGNLSWGAAAGGGGVSATGNNTQIQFNDGGVLGASANLVFDKTTNTFTTGRVVASAGANLGTNVANVYIGGGSDNQILKTDGSGNLTWIAQPVATMTVDNFTGDGTTTAFTLSTAPTNINFTVVNYNGAFQLRSAYAISGTTITFSEAPVDGSLIEVTTTSGATSGAGSFVTRTYTGNGVATTYTVTSGVTVSSVIVTENGLVQTPTVDYTISGSTLTFIAAPANGITIQIRELAIAIVTPSSSVLTIKDEGSNLTTTASSIDFVGGGVTATNTGNAVTVTIPSGSSNARAMGYSLVFGG